MELLWRVCSQRSVDLLNYSLFEPPYVQTAEGLSFHPASEMLPLLTRGLECITSPVHLLFSLLLAGCLI